MREGGSGVVAHRKDDERGRGPCSPPSSERFPPGVVPPPMPMPPVAVLLPCATAATGAGVSLLRPRPASAPGLAARISSSRSNAPFFGPPPAKSSVSSPAFFGPPPAFFGPPPAKSSVSVSRGRLRAAPSLAPSLAAMVSGRRSRVRGEQSRKRDCDSASPRAYLRVRVAREGTCKGWAHERLEMWPPLASLVSQTRVA